MARPEGPSPSSGHVIAGRYELGAIIGRGGHGLVWRAHDRKTGRPVAVKMLTDVAAKAPQRGARIAVPAMLAVLAPVVTTLERAHERGIIHRDLKPANVFLVAEKAGGGVRVLDFGLARLRSALPLTAAGTIVGSPSYIAPEAWKGRSEALDQRVDVYSFGVLVFRALTGQFPFPGSSLREKFTGATTAPRPKLSPLRPDLGPEIDEWVAQVLAIDPDLRFRSMRGAWNALLAALGDPALMTSLVTAEDLASAAAAESAPLAMPSPPSSAAAATAAAPPPQPPPPPPRAEAPPRSYDSGSIEIPMSGALPALRAVLKRAATVVARATEVVRGGERRRAPLENAATPLPAPIAPARPQPAVTVSPVIAVGSPPRGREGKSMVREWLAGSELDLGPRTGGEPSDVVAWLSGEQPPVTREQTLPMAVSSPAVAPPEPAAAEEPTEQKKPRGRGPARAKTATPQRPVKQAAPKKKAASKKPAKKKATRKKRSKKA